MMKEYITTKEGIRNEEIMNVCCGCDIETPGPIFNPHGTWMDRVTPELLKRYWCKKGSPGTFIFHTKFGVDIGCFKTVFGEIRFQSFKVIE